MIKGTVLFLCRRKYAPLKAIL